MAHPYSWADLHSVVALHFPCYWMDEQHVAAVVEPYWVESRSVVALYFPYYRMDEQPAAALVEPFWVD